MECVRHVTEFPSEFKIWDEMTEEEKGSWTVWIKAQPNMVNSRIRHLASVIGKTVSGGLDLAFDATMWIAERQPKILEWDDETIITNIKMIIENRLMEDVL